MAIAIVQVQLDLVKPLWYGHRLNRKSKTGPTSASRNFEVRDQVPCQGCGTDRSTPVDSAVGANPDGLGLREKSLLPTHLRDNLNQKHDSQYGRDQSDYQKKPTGHSEPVPETERSDSGGGDPRKPGWQRAF